MSAYLSIILALAIPEDTQYVLIAHISRSSERHINRYHEDCTGYITENPNVLVTTRQEAYKFKNKTWAYVWSQWLMKYYDGYSCYVRPMDINLITDKYEENLNLGYKISIYPKKGSES